MADQTSTAIGNPGDTLPTLTLAVTAKTYEFTYSGTGGGRPINRLVQLVSTDAWHVASPADANYVPVAPNQAYAMRLKAATVTVYCKADSGAPVLSVAIAE